MFIKCLQVLTMPTLSNIPLLFLPLINVLDNISKTLLLVITDY